MNDYDIVVSGAGPAGLGFTQSLVELCKDPLSFNEKFFFLPKKIKNELKEGLNLRICILKSYRPSNQFVASWAAQYDELKPFGYNINKYIQYRTKYIEWEFLSRSFKYEFPYCSINTNNFFNDIERKLRNAVVFEDTTLLSASVNSNNVIITTPQKKISAKILVDCTGYHSPLNIKYEKNEHSPIYQMLIWKFASIENFEKNVNNILYKPASLYKLPNFNVNDHIMGWFHPLNDGMIVGASKYCYKEIPISQLKTELRRYLQEYMRIKNLKPDSDYEEITGTGVLYNPYQQLNLDRILQIGDSAKICRPSTGYGFIPALWHGLFGAISTFLAIQKNKFTFHSLEQKTKSLFDKFFLMNYSLGYITQRLYLDGPWDNVESTFSVVDQVIQKLDIRFLDRLFYHAIYK